MNGLQSSITQNTVTAPGAVLAIDPSLPSSAIRRTIRDLQKQLRKQLSRSRGRASRQYRWQEARRRAGRCVVCGRRRSGQSKRLCKLHLEQARERRKSNRHDRRKQLP